MSKRALIRMGFGAVLLVVTFTAPTLHASASDVVASLTFYPAQLAFEKHDGYDLVSLDGAAFTTEPSEPMLPSVSVQLLLPPGASADDIEVITGGSVYLPGEFDIVPAPRPETYSSGAVAAIPHQNAETYSSVLPYPRTVAHLAGVGSSDGLRVASVLVRPLQYFPAQGRLVLHTEIEIRIRTAASERASVASTGDAALRVARASLLNPDELSAYESSSESRDGAGAEAIDYIVIAPASYAAEFEALTEWKTRKGVRAEVITLESVLTDPSYMGSDDAETLRNCIREYHEVNGTSWVLLGGDTEVVPSRNAFDFFYDQGLPCDLYFADLDGSWNDDGDDRWGEIESDGVDMYSDVFVGRAPVVDAEGAATFVEKTLAYEGALFGLSNDWQLKMLFLGEVLWDSPDPFTDGAVALDMIDDGYVPQRFKPVTKLYETDGTLSYSSAFSALNDGQNIVAHQGHANISAASVGSGTLVNASLDALSNGETGGVWYSIGCWSAAIDNDTFGEHWLTNPDGGGIAYVGNSRYGWGCPGYPGQCVSDLFSQEFFSSLLQKGLVNVGAAHADAKHQFIAGATSDDYTRYAMYELNLLGDPETAIWTDEPEPLSVDAPDRVSADGGSVDLSIHVSRAGAPLRSAVVCLSSENGVYEVAESDLSGTAAFSFEAEVGDELTLTVTALNSMPFGDSIIVDSPTSVDDGFGEGRVTALVQNYPNPFNPSTTLSYSLAARQHVTVGIYDVSGRRVAVVADGEMDAGPHQVHWDGKDDAGRDTVSGTYFARMMTEGVTYERKMTLLR